MTEQDRSPRTRGEIHKRMLAANALFGIDSSGCFDGLDGRAVKRPEIAEGDDFYTVSLDIESGKVSAAPGNPE